MTSDVPTPNIEPEATVGVPRKARRLRVNLPLPIAASALAITTVLTSLPPTHFPPWAIFISWAGTFASGGPKRDVFKKLWPTMPIGSITAFLIVLGFNTTAPFFSGWAYVIVEMIILGCLNSAQIVLGQLVKQLSFVPGMFFGFASYFATYYGGFGPIAHNPFAALGAVVFMNALGPLYAWVNVKLMAPEHEQ